MLTMKAVFHVLRNYYNLTLATGLGSAFVLYYILYVGKKPRLCGNNKFRAFLVEHVPILQEKFWPTFWCFEARAQTILRVFIKSTPEAGYHKEFVETADGGHIAVDWQENDSSSTHKDPATRPTVLILPGLTGSSQESYALHFVQQATRLGYRSVVFNYRGNGGAELKTARSYCAANTEDLALVVSHIKARYPKAPIVAAGVSLGGITLINYLASTPNHHISAALGLCIAWELFKCKDSLEEPINAFIFNRTLAHHMKEGIRRYSHLFEDKVDLEHVFQSKTIRDFDDRFTAKQFGYPSWREYYHDASPHHKIHKIKIPVLCLNAADDPFSPEYALPMKECSESSHVCMIVTRHGGHIGFLEGLFPRHESFMDRVFAQYIDSVFKHGDKLSDMLSKES